MVWDRFCGIPYNEPWSPCSCSGSGWSPLHRSAVPCKKKGLFERALTNVLEKIAVTDVFQNFASHDIFDAGGLVYYISIIFLLVFLTVQSIEKRRWS